VQTFSVTDFKYITSAWTDPLPFSSVLSFSCEYVQFGALGIDFVSLHEGVDTATPNGRLVFGIFASIAEFEREVNS
jgi:hypothetical protein